MRGAASAPPPPGPPLAGAAAASCRQLSRSGSRTPLISSSLPESRCRAPQPSRLLPTARVSEGGPGLRAARLRRRLRRSVSGMLRAARRPRTRSETGGPRGHSPHTRTKGGSGCHPEVTSGWARAGEAGWAEDGGAAASPLVAGTDARLGDAVWQWFFGPEPLLPLWCLSRAWLSHCKAVVCTGSLTSESRLAASSSGGGGGVCVHPQGRELMTLLCFRRPKGCVSCELSRSGIN